MVAIFHLIIRLDIFKQKSNWDQTCQKYISQSNLKLLYAKELNIT